MNNHHNIELLKGLGTLKRFKEDEFIFREGESGNEVYIILSGKVGVYLDSFSDYPIKISEMGPGELFGEMSVLEDQPRSASIVAAKETIVLEINKANFELFISKRPDMAYKIMKSLSGRIRRMNDEINELRMQLRKMNNPAMNNQVRTEKKLADAQPAQEAKPGIDEKAQKVPYAPGITLFPEGHKIYGKAAPDTHEDFLFDKPVTCPICGEKFIARMQRTSKLRLYKVEPDFRRRFVDFEPLWYSVLVCPKCYYSSFHYDFDQVNKVYAKPLREKLDEIKSNLPLNIEYPRDVDKVFSVYYLALACATVCKAPPLKFAKLWLQLSWLYEDCEDAEMMKMAKNLALEHYYNAYYNSKLNITVEEEQQCCIVLGELFLAKGDFNEAIKHLHKAINRNSGSHTLNRQAQDRIQDIKNMVKENS